MNWVDRIERAIRAGRFDHADIVSAFNRKESLVAEFGFALDEWGIALDGYAARLNDAFGWSVLSDAPEKASRIYAAMLSLSTMRHGEKAA